MLMTLIVSSSRSMPARTGVLGTMSRSHSALGLSISLGSASVIEGCVLRRPDPLGFGLGLKVLTVSGTL